MAKKRNPHIEVRNTEPRDFPAIAEMSRRVYPDDEPWTHEQLASHRRVFPEGQLVAVDTRTDEVVGMAASLIIQWDDYNLYHNYQELTGNYLFTNHNPRGRTLYGAEVMTHPKRRGEGIGKLIYRARRDLARRLRLRRIRAGARLRNYSVYSHLLSPEAYVDRVVRGEIIDPTLTFQLRNGFRVLYIVREYLDDDRPSMGYAAVVEWINHKVARRKDYAGRDQRFARPLPPKKAAATSPRSG